MTYLIKSHSLLYLLFLLDFLQVLLHKLSEVFLALQKVLGEEHAPSAKSSDADLKALFEKAIPDYDADRFYVSHMKKVVEWYNELLDHASLDFTTEEEENNDEAHA